jgi:GTP-binding protein EngB required for normal cell division
MSEDNRLFRRELLDILSEVKSRVQDRLGVLDLPLPQFILIGKQSVGKSRLIEALAGETFTFVSGTLGSRRPTVLEFRFVPSLLESKWQILDKKTNKYVSYGSNTDEVCRVISAAHESLGATVSNDAVYVRLESPFCVDMQIVDLPGFRDFALDQTKQQLNEAIESMVYNFMRDERNVMLCVEESGDAATLSTLARCKKLDSNFARTVLIRNKMDKYYKDLTNENVTKWLSGYGDLPESLPKFALTLPHWKEGEMCPGNFVEIRKQRSVDDVDEIKSRGVSDPRLLAFVGFDAFSMFMSSKIESMFTQSLGPVLRKLKDLKEVNEIKFNELIEEVDNSNPITLTALIREIGMSFSHALNHVMEGFVRSDQGRLTLHEELELFHKFHLSLGTAVTHDHLRPSKTPSSASRTPVSTSKPFALLPSPDFRDLADYAEYLRSEIRVPAADVSINGGAQFRRLMFEVEVFLRFSEIGVETRKQDVIQARGVSMGSVTWRDVVVKLLSNEAHLPMKDRVRYVAERIKFFFMQQKECIVDFMGKIKGSSDEQMFSSLYSKHVKLILDNPVIRAKVYETYDKAIERQMFSFIELFNNTLASTFSNPWVFLKRAASVTVHQDEHPQLQTNTVPAASATANKQQQQPPQSQPQPQSAQPPQQSQPPQSQDRRASGELDMRLASFSETKSRIPWELESRSGWETVLSQWLSLIPQEPQQIDEAVEKVQMLVLKTFSFIRAQIADQIELFAESFFKLPMMRRLEEDMSLIEVSENDKREYEGRKEALVKEEKRLEIMINDLDDCVRKLSVFLVKSQAANARRARNPNGARNI